MNAFKKKLLVSAVLAGMGSIATTAQAVYVDPGNLGQGLLYPYYTVQGNQNTYMTIVNTSTSGVKVVKVRFREGKASNEVLDFNLYLSPADVWVGVVQPADTGNANSPGLITTPDVSCTNPAIPATGQPFRNFAYSGDGLGDGLERTREGYIEVIEMGVLPAGSALGAAAIHGASGSPTCTGLRGSNLAAAINAVITPPTGGMSGQGTIVNVATGADNGYDATALAALTAAPIYFDIVTDFPNANNYDAVSGVFANNRAYRSTFATGADAVSSTLMHTHVINEYILDNATKSNTDWVLTFPTKNRYVTALAATTPFTNKLTTAGACETISFTFWDREERSVTPTSGDFSPLPPNAPASSLCWESTVLSVRNGATHNPTGSVSGPLASVNVTNVTVTTGFQGGWGLLQFDGANARNNGILATGKAATNLTPGAASAVAARYLGLPVIGFMTRTFNNATVAATAGANLAYRDAYPHAYFTNILPLF